MTKLCDVPTDDGGLAQALGEVDAAMSVWLAAVEEANVRLAALAQAQGRDVDAPEAAAAATDEATDVAEPVADEPIAESTASPTDDLTQNVAPAPLDSHAEPSDDAAEPFEPEPSDGSTPTVETEQPEPSDESNPPAGPEEDAALLASLDPETVEAIRVLQRMSISKRSVRELLDYYEASKHRAPTEATHRRSWFSRRK